jgi:hypothetical protein
MLRGENVNFGDFLNTISNTPLANILVLAGIVFLLLSTAGSLAGKIVVEPAKQKFAGIIGGVLLGLGIVLLFYAPGPTTKPPPAPSPAQPTPAAPPPTPAPNLNPPAPAPAPNPNPSPPTPAPNLNPPNAGPGPGVVCTATPTERTICDSVKLSALDRELFAIYWALFNRSDKTQKDKLHTEETVWVAQRNRCQRDESCLEATYKSRLDQLKHE